MSKVYTGIGSRKTPLDIQQLMEAYANHLAVNGWTLRSGGAEGADQAFQRGVHGGPKEIYVPWDGFNNFTHDPANGFFATKRFSNWVEAQKIASNNHPAWHKCGDGVRTLHTRNVYQVLGRDLDSPTHMVVYYSEVNSKGNPKGGTAMAVNIAKQCGVPTCNLYFEKNRQIVTNIIHEGLTK